MKKFMFIAIITILLFSAVSAASYLQRNIDNLTVMIKGEKQEFNPILNIGITYASIKDFTELIGFNICDAKYKLIKFMNKNEDELDLLIKAYNRLYYDQFFQIRDWENPVNDWQSEIEPYGERGTFTWATSDYLESEVLMYKATKDPIYLNRVIDVMDKVLDLRDSETKRINEYGESPPVWSSGSRYGWGKSIVNNNRGEAVVEVLTYGTWEVDTGIVGELRNGNDITYITVSAGSVEGTFKVRIENANKGFDRTYDKLSLKEEGIISDDNSVRITALKASDGLPIFQERDYIGNILTPRPVNTGLMFNPMIQLAEVIKKEKLSEYYQKKANDYIAAAIDALEYHEVDWVDIDDQRGYYSEFNKDKRPLPWNQMFEPGKVLIGIYNITGEVQFKEKAEKMINYFKENLEYDKKNDLYIWKYLNWEGYTATENVNYARIDMTFIYEAYRAGIGFTEEDMNRFINTYRKNVYRSDDSIANGVNGKGNYDSEELFKLARVNFLSEWGYDYFFYEPVKWVEEIKNREEEDYEKLVSIARSVYQKRIIDPEWVDITDQKKIGKYRQ